MNFSGELDPSFAKASEDTGAMHLGAVVAAVKVKLRHIIIIYYINHA